MTPQDFWYGEPNLFFVYLEAYRDRLNEQAWLFGLYTNLAVSISLGNSFRNKTAEPLKYPTEPMDLDGSKANKNMVNRNKIASQHFNKQAKTKDLIMNMIKKHNEI